MASTQYRVCGFYMIRQWRSVPQFCRNWGDRCYSIFQISEEDESVPRNVFVRSIASILQKTDRWDSLLKELCAVSASKITPPVAVQVMKRMKKPRVAFEFFEWLDKFEGFDHDSLSYSAIIKVLTRDRKPSHAAIADSLLRRKIDLDLGVTQVDYDYVLNQWARVGRSDYGLSLLEEMIARGFTPSISSCRVLLDDLFRSKQEDLAWKLFDRIHRREIDVLHPETFNVALKNLCVKGNFEGALELFTKLKAEGFKPNLDSFNIMIKGSCQTGKVEILCDLFESMLDFNVKPDSYTMNLLIKELCKQGKPEYGNYLFNHMRKVGWIDRKFVYTQLVESLCDYGWWLKALKIFVKMVRRGHHPNSGLYVDLIRRLCMGGRVREAFKLKDLCLKKGFLPEIEIYNGLIDGLCLSGSMDLVEKLLAEIDEVGLQPESRTYNMVLRGYCLSRNAEAAIEWVKKMKDMGVRLNLEPCNLLATSLADEGRIDEALQVKSCAQGMVLISPD